MTVEFDKNKKLYTIKNGDISKVYTVRGVLDNFFADFEADDFMKIINADIENIKVDDIYSTYGDFYVKTNNDLFMVLLHIMLSNNIIPNSLYYASYDSPLCISIVKSSKNDNLKNECIGNWDFKNGEPYKVIKFALDAIEKSIFTGEEYTIETDLKDTMKYKKQGDGKEISLSNREKIFTMHFKSKSFDETIITTSYSSALILKLLYIQIERWQ